MTKPLKMYQVYNDIGYIELIHTACGDLFWFHMYLFSLYLLQNKEVIHMNIWYYPCLLPEYNPYLIHFVSIPSKVRKLQNHSNLCAPRVYNYHVGLVINCEHTSPICPLVVEGACGVPRGKLWWCTIVCN